MRTFTPRNCESATSTSRDGQVKVDRSIKGESSCAAMA